MQSRTGKTPSQRSPNVAGSVQAPGRAHLPSPAPAEVAPLASAAITAAGVPPRAPLAPVPVQGTSAAASDAAPSAADELAALRARIAALELQVELHRRGGGVDGAMAVAPAHSRTPSGTSDRSAQLAYVLIDNSNFFITAKKQVPWLMGIDLDELQGLRIEYGKLLDVILKGRNMELAGGALVGSKPPTIDSLWKRITPEKLECITLDRHPITKREKGVDVALGMRGQKIMDKEKRGTIILIAGDGDFTPLFTEAALQGWSAEVWFWTYGCHFKDRPDFKNLDPDYSKFCFGEGVPPSDSKAFELSITVHQLTFLPLDVVNEVAVELDTLSWHCGPYHDQTSHTKQWSVVYWSLEMRRRAKDKLEEKLKQREVSAAFDIW